jgi:hypothetical protein
MGMGNVSISEIDETSTAMEHELDTKRLSINSIMVKNRFGMRQTLNNLAPIKDDEYSSAIRSIDESSDIK